MSGIEVAGLVLGALPILFAAVDASRQSLSKGRVFFRTRKYVEKLSNALLMQEQTLLEVIKSILLGSGCDDMCRLEDDPVAYLRNDIVQEQILDYLGDGNIAAFNGSINQCQNTLKGVATRIGGLVPALQDSPCNNLLQIVEANREEKRGQKTIVPRIKLMFGVEELKELLKDLDDTTNALFRLASLVSSNHQPAMQRTSRKARTLARDLRQAHKSAKELYFAIRNVWQGDCHQIHEAKLCLEDRVDVPKRAASGPVFSLIFAATSSDGKKMWHEAAVHALDHEQDEGDKAQTTVVHPQTGNSRRVIVVTPPNWSTKPQVNAVENICVAMGPVLCSKPQLAFVLSHPIQIGTTQLDGPRPTLCTWSEKISLETVFAGQGGGKSTSVLSLRLRMLLALRLASNTLQLLQTQWFHGALSHDKIFFLAGTTCSGGKNLSTDFTRPFVTATFTKGSPTPSQRDVEPREALLELGILLLEVWHQKSLEAYYNLTKSPVEYYERLAIALRWLDDIDDPPPEMYDKAVAHCIKGMIGGEARLGQWDDPNFWNGVCGDIIEPLSKNCKMWR